MPKQNRVNPFGDIFTTTAKGTLMGNRGCIHNPNQQIITQWARKAWVTCLLDYKGRHREIMAPGKYTELFFLDEATALAAGHRPCGTCQKSRYDDFKKLWFSTIASTHDHDQSIQELDVQLHGERVASGGKSCIWRSKFNDLPNGTFITLSESDVSSWLVWNKYIYKWSPSGYTGKAERPNHEYAFVITPKSIVDTLFAGFIPKVHETMDSLLPDEFRDDPLRKDIQSGNSSLPATKSTPITKKDIPSIQLYRLKRTPSGKALFTYFAAILRVSGMDKGQTFPLSKFLSNFSGHINAGRIERAGDEYRLTKKGSDYFSDRYRKGNRQHVDEYEVQLLAKRLKEGGEDLEPI